MLVSYLSTSNPGRCNFFSVDVQDLYHNIPRGPLLSSVKHCIMEDNDETEFVSKCGISADAFLKLLTFPLESILSSGIMLCTIALNRSCNTKVRFFCASAVILLYSANMAALAQKYCLT